MFMGFTCQFGGKSASSAKLKQFYDENNLSDDLILAAQSETSGFGFAAFCYIVAAVGALGVSLYMCVPVCGSDLEKRTLNHPYELERSTAEPYESYASSANMPVAQPYTGAQQEQVCKPEPV